MNFNKQNSQAISEALITDMQRRLFKQYNARKEEFNIRDEDYDVQQTLLIDRVLHCNSIKDINDLLLEYTDLFNDYDSINVFTLDGTLNYVLGLLVDKLNYMKENNG
jgi:hypothetical protein